MLEACAQRGVKHFIYTSSAALSADPHGRVTLLFFWAVGCPHCEEAKPFMERLRRERAWLGVEAIEVRQDLAGRRRFVETMRRLGITQLEVPTFVAGEGHVVGFVKGVTEAAIARLVDRASDQR